MYIVPLYVIMPQLCGARACTPIIKSIRSTYFGISPGSVTLPRLDRHRQLFLSPTASNTAFIAMFFMKSGITFSASARSLLTFVAMRVPISFAV